MKKAFPVSLEFIYQLFSLILIIIIVHAVYLAVIRPKADAILAEQAAEYIPAGIDTQQDLEAVRKSF